MEIDGARFEGLEISVDPLVDVPDFSFEASHLLLVDGCALEEVVFAEGKPLARSSLFLRPHMQQRSQRAQQLGCRLLDDDSVEMNDFGNTSVQGVYAVGDMARRPAFPFPTAQVVMAAAAGAMAAVVIDQERFFVDLYS